MSRRCLPLFPFLLSWVMLLCGAGFAQKDAPAAPPEQKKPAISSESRLLAAKTVFVRRPRGNTIPYDAISAGFEGWGRYAVVNDETKAELIVEVTAPQESSGFSVSGSTSANNGNGQATKSTKEFSNAPVRMVVFDGRTKTPLWSSFEQPKSAMRRKAQEDNQVEASQRLFRKFHDRIEPLPAE